MSNHANYGKIGFTVILGIAATVAVLIYLGGVGANSDILYAETYYDNPVTGLSVGSDVNLRGVKVGEVREISFIGSEYEEADGKDVPKIHPAQKPVSVLKKLIEVCTDPGDVVIDPCCGSGSTLRAAYELGRSAYGFEIDRTFYTRAKEEMLVFPKSEQMSIFDLE